MIRTAFAGMSPPMRLVFFFCSCVAGMGATLTLVLAGASFLWGLDTEAVQTLALQVHTPRGRALQWTINGLNQLISFGGAAALFVVLFGRMPAPVSAQPARPRLAGWIAAGLAVGAAAPVLADAISRLDRKLADLTPWADAIADLEARAAPITIEMLSFSSPAQALIALLVVAILPAICEELAFRGAVQQTLARWTGRAGISVVLAALLFSAIHLQFHGFFARAALGAVFGMLAVASGSLWPAIAAHFANNASAVVQAWLEGPTWVQGAFSPEAMLEPVPVWEVAVAGGVLAGIAGVLWWAGVRWRPRAAAYVGAARNRSNERPDREVSGPPAGTPGPR
jgi:membrane protease YdiL (CAAX protease family)